MTHQYQVIPPPQSLKAWVTEAAGSRAFPPPQSHTAASVGLECLIVSLRRDSEKAKLGVFLYSEFFCMLWLHCRSFWIRHFTDLMTEPTVSELVVHHFTIIRILCHAANYIWWFCWLYSWQDTFLLIEHYGQHHRDTVIDLKHIEVKASRRPNICYTAILLESMS